MSEFKVDIKTLTALGLGFEQYFVLYCLYKKDKELLLTYITRCKKIDLKVFTQLTEGGYLTVDNIDNIRYEGLTLTREGNQVFEPDKSGLFRAEAIKAEAKNSERFEEFRKNYPSRVKEGFKSRPLHTNLKRCKQLYSKLIDDGDISHEMLCKCARLYHKERERSRSEWYMQALETWLYQRNFEPYIDLEEDNVDPERKWTDDI
jgi:hypothetical protein